MVRSTTANGTRGSQKVLVLKFGQTVVVMKATGIKVNRLEKALRHIRTVQRKKASGRVEFL
jgi:hypothetical protein